MRRSEMLTPTRRDTPAGAVAPSHDLLVRAGMLHPMAAGLYGYGPDLVRVLRRVERVVCQEMDAVGGQQMLLPALQPQALWVASGRWRRFVEVDRLMLTTVDRGGASFGLGPTHEEAVASVVGPLLRSYRDLPALVYQVQTKYRDEPRPRFGLLRTREFLMKDAYSFDLDPDGMAAAYDRVGRAYRRVFDRVGLEVVPVRADVGAMGGRASTEFMALADVGEDVVVVGADGDAANLEAARAHVAPPAVPAEEPAAVVDTPGARTVEEVAALLGVPPTRVVKTLLFRTADTSGGQVVAVLVRGDRAVNLAKLQTVLDADTVEPATDTEVRDVTGAEPGFAGPIGLADHVRLVADARALAVQGFVCGANRTDAHLRDVWWGRDLERPEPVDVDLVQEGDVDAAGRPLRLARGIEVGHIFQLGTRYSEAFDLHVTGRDGARRTVWMGSYGIGLTRLVAAVVEQHHDDAGILWPTAVAPHDVVIVQVGASDAHARMAAELHDDLGARGLDVVWDDRDVAPGVKFGDADLVGVPWRVVVGRDAVRGQVEVGARDGHVTRVVPIDEVAALVDAT